MSILMSRVMRIRLVVIASIVVALEVACRANLISSYTLIPPSEMAIAFFKLLRNGQVLADVGKTLIAIALAAGFAIAAGLSIAVVLHALPRLRRALDPVMTVYYSIPVFVFYPFFIVLFGLNDVPKVIIGFLLAVVAMITSTLNGLDRVPGALRKTAEVYRMSHLATTCLIVVPSAAPNIFNGIKLSIAYAFVGVLGAEFILSTGGIGYQIAYAFNDFDNPQMYSLVVLILVVVSIVNAVLFGWETRLRRRRGLT